MPFVACVRACVRVRVCACLSAEDCAQADTSGHLNDLNVSLQVGSEYGFNDHLMWADQFAGRLLRAFSLRECTVENIFITLCILNCSKTISRWDRPLQKTFFGILFGENGTTWKLWNINRQLHLLLAVSDAKHVRLKMNFINFIVLKDICLGLTSARHKCTKTTYTQRAHTWQSSSIKKVFQRVEVIITRLVSANWF